MRLRLLSQAAELGSKAWLEVQFGSCPSEPQNSRHVRQEGLGRATDEVPGLAASFLPTPAGGWGKGVRLGTAQPAQP